MEWLSAIFQWLITNWDDFWPVLFAGVSALVAVLAYYKTVTQARQAKRQADAAEVHNELMQRQIDLAEGNLMPVRREGPNSEEPPPKVAPLVIRCIEQDLYEFINGGDRDIFDVTIWESTPEISDLHWDYIRPGESDQFVCVPGNESRTIKVSWKPEPNSVNTFNWDVPVPLKGR